MSANRVAGGGACSQELWDGIPHSATAADLKARYGARLEAEAAAAGPDQLDYPRFRVDRFQLCGATYSAYLHFPGDGRDVLTGVSLRASAQTTDQAGCMLKEFSARYGKPRESRRTAAGSTAVFLKNGTWVVLQTDRASGMVFVHLEAAYD
jgi:hypothetical protein